MISGEEKELLRETIRGLGFDEVCFSDLQPIAKNRLQEWIAAGYHADMEWLARSIEKRLDPTQVLEGACSVIMLGINYLPPEEERARSQTGFAKYSLYRDYHDTMLEGVRKIGALLEDRYELGGRDYRYYVDTGPVMERGWAAAAGLGWQGKNGMLISRTHGNWLLLATVLTRLEIEADGPLKKSASAAKAASAEMGLLCGKCTRCMDACPTDAIVEPGIVDTRRCISYQTIENKGSIPRDIREKMGGRVYGCDICLDVCPWNRFAEAGRRQLIESRYDVADLGLLDLLRMDAEGFRETFRKMPMKRTKLRGLKRNACIAAGNLGECTDWWPDDAKRGSEAGEAWIGEVRHALLELAEGDSESLVREHAVWAVYRLFGDAASGVLKGARDCETDESVLAEYAAW